ncbi:MAG TPA: hypothetical protein DDW98_15775 [Gammaproteobacteria bacterium]|jgi:hypothetical protein|nr:hypothetical protein [Gammaproteobacteria bacterium]
MQRVTRKLFEVYDSDPEAPARLLVTGVKHDAESLLTELEQAEATFPKDDDFVTPHMQGDEFAAAMDRLTEAVVKWSDKHPNAAAHRLFRTPPFRLIESMVDFDREGEA